MRRLITIASVLAGCHDSGDSAWRGTLDVDIRDSVDATLVPHGATDLDATLAFTTSGFDLFDHASPLRLPVHIEAFPEAGLTLYVGTLSLPPFAGGRCADQPVSLALALSRKEQNDRVQGSLTAYCGESTYSGVPARVLRIVGSLPMPASSGQK